jgi:hypothetical protein
MPDEIRNSQFTIRNSQSRLTFARFSRAVPDVSLFTRYSSLVALTLLASWPLLTSGLPTVGDGLIHFHRFAQLDWHFRHGDFYPRWFVNLHYGFGAPVFNFYAPLSYYIPLIFRLFNLPLPTSLLLGYVLAFAVAIFGTYHWANNLFDSPNHPTAQPAGANHPTTGLIASAAFALSPYLYLNTLHRGAYPELWGLALAPWLLWSAHRLALGPNPRSRLSFVVIQSALILTHTLSALIFSPIALFYLITLLLSAGNRRSTLRILGFWLLGFGLSLALTAFFTLPVLLESKDIQLFRTFLPGDLDYRNNFLTLSTLLSPPANFDPHLVFNAMPASLPWPQLALAAVSLPLLRKTQYALRVILLTAFCLLLSFLTLSTSAPLWNNLPLARFIQFPWRLVGPASLFLAALAGVSLSRSSRLTFVVSLFAVASFFLFSLSWTYHTNFTSLPATVTPADAVNYETATGQLGTTSTGEYLPRWVTELPAPDTLNFTAADIPSRLAPPPANVTFDVSRLTLHREDIAYTSPSPFTATFNRFYFPGWAATVDGQPVEPRPSTPNGLITVAAPAGQHTLRLELRPTAPQLAGISLSLVTLAALLLLALRRPTIAIENRSHNRQPVFIVSAFIVSLLIARLLYFDRVETPFHHTNLDNLPNPVAVNFEDQLELIGFEHPPTITSNNQLPITLYWRALAPLTADYSTTVQLADRFGNRFGQSDSQHPGRVPTSRWALDQYARDTHTLLSLPGTPPGTYHLLITVYADRPLSVLQDNAPIGVEYDLGTVTVTRADPQPPGPLRLVDLEMAGRTVSVGDTLSFTMLLNSGNDPIPGLAATLTLADSSNQPFFSASISPAGPDYLSEQWTPNELIRYPHSVLLPPELRSGPARVSLTFVDGQGTVAVGPFDLGEITIIAPDRSFVIPPMSQRVDHDFDDSIRLLGYDLDSDSITLYWQSLQPVSARLTVFVHALDANGAFVAGHDASPARPTTGWLSGEVIADAHPVAVGDHFEVGLYDPISGERFGETFVTHP